MASSYESVVDQRSLLLYRRPVPRPSNVTLLLHRLLVSWVDQAVGDQCEKQNDTLHQILGRVRNVEDGHAVEHDTNEVRAYEDAADICRAHR
jgi:hypothetical protein